MYVHKSKNKEEKLIRTSIKLQRTLFFSKKNPCDFISDEWSRKNLSKFAFGNDNFLVIDTVKIIKMVFVDYTIFKI